jgi:NADPH:quinone reductase-like Zn-dependent oxidoreductase
MVSTARVSISLGGLCFALLALSAFDTRAADATTMRRYELKRIETGYALALATTPRPAPAKDQVLVRIRAVSLNHRDLYALQRIGGADSSGRIPVSDGAGEVVAIGADVKQFKIGDRVAGTFFEQWTDGKPTPAASMSARGGQAPGVLSEYVAAHENSWVKFPAHLSFEEASTLPCAGVTAWNALFTMGHMQPGDIVLLEGTGGVSIFGLQFAAAGGGKPIITSSSDTKLERARSMGAIGTVNYRTNVDWEREVRTLSGGRGVDHVLEVGGKDTLPRALKALALGGQVNLIGGLTGFNGQIDVGAVSGVQGTVRGIYVGSRADFTAMNAFIAKHALKPVIDKTFAFEQAKAAFEYLESGSHFGKVVVTL